MPPPRNRPSVDTFWSDGGMKPPTPEELSTDGEDLSDEGMLFIGDKGKILCDFRANKPRLIPGNRQKCARRVDAGAHRGGHDQDADEWVNAIRTGGKSRGGFEQVAALAEAVTLAAIALRVPYKRLLWDAGKAEFTDSPEANAFVRRFSQGSAA